MPEFSKQIFNVLQKALKKHIKLGNILDDSKSRSNQSKSNDKAQVMTTNRKLSRSLAC